MDGTRRHVDAVLRAGTRALLLSAAWLVFSLPLVTWMASAAALVHSVERAGRPEDAGALAEFWQGWRRHWRVALPLGAVALLVLVALLANLLFLSGQGGTAAVLLLVGTLVLLVLWAMSALSLIPVLVLLPHLPGRESLRLGLVLAFGHPVSTIGLVVGSVLLAAALEQLWTPLVLLAAPVIGYLSLRLARRHLRAMA